jgi:subtilisin family serine protease
MAKVHVRLIGGLVAALLLMNVAGAQESFPQSPPNDPRYAAFECPDPRSEGASGQWNLFSFAPGCAPPPTHPSGISADEAWKVTTGRSDVVIAVLDTGVDYDHEDLRTKIWLNEGELPPPAPPDGCTGAGHDCNGDGVFNVVDYVGDPRLAGDVNGSGVVDRGDLRVLADGVDDDGNGYVDDLSGWDTDDDDGDEFDHRYFGHGTGRAGIVGPATDNGRGVAGVCPDCPLMNVRVDDSFVVQSEGVAKGAIYAIDNGASVINMALGATTASRLSRGAFDYATSRNVLAVNATANEFSYHQNFQTVFDDVMGIGAVTPDNRQNVTTYLRKANFANYGAHLDVVGPTDVPGASQRGPDENGQPIHDGYTETASGTSSSVPHAAGVAALVFSRARDLIAAGELDVTGLALADISAQEVRQIINRSAHDVASGDDEPSPVGYPVRAGWDRWTGYGRVNARAAVDLIAPGTIPPEADINAPGWYRLVDGSVTVRFYANARWAESFSFQLEWGAGVEPDEWNDISSRTGVASDPGLSSANRVSNSGATWDAGALEEGLYTLRLRVTDDLGNVGVDRMALWVRHTDPDDMTGFPRRFSGSAESLSVALVDLNGDNRLEVVFADGNGIVHALRWDGREVRGFPVHTRRVRHLPLATSDAFDGNRANGEVRVSYASALGGVAVGDIDRDGVQNVVVAAGDGRVYCWTGNGSRCPGFPAAADHGFSRDPYGDHRQIRNNHPEAFAATPVLGNIRGDRRLEIVVGSIDQKLYVWRADGSRVSPFPIRLVDPSAPPDERRRDREIAPRAIVSTAAIANVDAAGRKEIVVGTNETYSTPSPSPGVGGSGRAYVVRADGSIAPGWPVKPTSIAPNPVPLVGEGVGTSPVVANVDGDPQKEIALSVFFGDATIYNHNGTTLTTMSGAFGATGAGSDDREETREGGLPRSADAPSHYYVAQQAFARFDGDARLDFLTGMVGNGIAVSATGSGVRPFFDHLLSVWDAATGAPKPAFPRVMEDWMFFTGPAVADIGGGTAAPEVIASSGGFWVHAFDSAGLEPSDRWPKLTGHWQTATPSVGDLDGDGDLEVVQTTRMGYVFAWTTEGVTCQREEWRKFHHDEWNTGTYGTDTRRPARIDDVSASRIGDRMTLRWTAPGDDGDCGRASAYQVRLSDQRIDGRNFGSARSVVVGLPDVAGSSEALTFRLPDWARYVAIRAIDEARNVGHLTLVGPLPR